MLSTSHPLDVCRTLNGIPLTACTPEGPCAFQFSNPVNVEPFQVEFQWHPVPVTGTEVNQACIMVGNATVAAGRTCLQGLTLPSYCL
jgi:hypothetical protein